MIKALQHTGFLWRNFGQCPACVRKAFLATVIAWLLALCCLIADRPTFFALVLANACVLTALWLAHILAFARKTSLFLESRPENGVAVSRRALWPLFLRAAATAAFASAISRTAFADSPCGGWPDQGLPCGACERRNTPDSDCEPCHSCGPDCEGNC